MNERMLEVSHARQRADCFRALQQLQVTEHGSDLKHVAVKVLDGGSEVGVLWLNPFGEISIIAAKALITGDTGPLGFLELLAVAQPRFVLLDVAADPPGIPLLIKVRDLAEDEPAVKESLKGVLWSVTGQQAAPVEVALPKNNPSMQSFPAMQQSATPAPNSNAEDPDDDLLQKRRSQIKGDLAVARRQSQKSPQDATAHPQVVSDDIAEKIRRDLEMANAGKLVNVAEAPVMPMLDPIRDPIAEATVSLDDEELKLLQQNEQYAEQQSVKPKFTGKEMKGESSASATYTRLSTLRTTDKTAAIETKKPAAIPVKWIAAACAVVSVISLGTWAYGAEQKRQQQDRESLDWLLNEALLADTVEPESNQQLRVAELQKSFEEVTRVIANPGKLVKLPDMHNPFRPPEIKESPSAPPPNGAGGPAQGSSLPSGRTGPNADDGTGGGTDFEVAASKFEPPKNLPPPLGKEQTAEAQNQIHVAEQLTAGGHQAEAAGVLVTALNRFPQHMPLRTAAIMACMRTKDYAQAKKLAKEGLSKAANYNDYSVCLSLVRSVADAERSVAH